MCNLCHAAHAPASAHSTRVCFRCGYGLSGGSALLPTTVLCSLHHCHAHLRPMCGGRPARARPRQQARAAATRADRQRLCRAPPRRSIQWSAAKRMSPTPHCGTSLRHLTAQAIQSAVGARCSSALSRLPRQLPLAYVFVYSMYYSAPISLVLPLSQCPLLCPMPCMVASRNCHISFFFAH